MPSAESRTQIDCGTRTSEHPDSVVLGNHDQLVEMNDEISINYIDSGELYNRKTTIVDIYFASNISSVELDPEPKTMAECQKHSEWVKWKEAIEAELRSLYRRNVFGPVVQTPPGVTPIGHKLVFVRKRNENNQVVRYKASLVEQGLSQRPGIDYDET